MANGARHVPLPRRHEGPGRRRCDPSVQQGDPQAEFHGRVEPMDHGTEVLTNREATNKCHPDHETLTGTLVVL